MRSTTRRNVGFCRKKTQFRYVAYRQALGEVPQELGFPHGINWPVPSDHCQEMLSRARPNAQV